MAIDKNSAQVYNQVEVLNYRKVVDFFMVDSLNGNQINVDVLSNNNVQLKSKSIDKIKALRFQHHCVSSIGGFLGAYAILNHNNIFASAQTANMIELIMDLLGKDIFNFSLRLGALIVYLFGFFITVYLPKFTKINIQTLALIIDTITIVLVSLIPRTTNDVIALYPIFFAMAIQWNSFVKVENYSSSTIFSTNNLKQATTSLMEYFLDNQKDPKKIDKSKFYGGTILGYHLGVALAFCSCSILEKQGIWLCIIPILISFISHIRVRKSED